MVRPSGQPDRHRLATGEATWCAIKKGLVTGQGHWSVHWTTTPADQPQGQEGRQPSSALILCPSFFEKALFIKEMQEAGYAVRHSGRTWFDKARHLQPTEGDRTTARRVDQTYRSGRNGNQARPVE